MEEVSDLFELAVKARYLKELKAKSKEHLFHMWGMACEKNSKKFIEAVNEMELEEKNKGAFIDLEAWTAFCSAAEEPKPSNDEIVIPIVPGEEKVFLEKKTILLASKEELDRRVKEAGGSFYYSDTRCTCFSNRCYLHDKLFS